VQLRTVTPVDACLSRLHRGAFFITHLDTAEGRLKLIGEPEHNLFRRRADRAADGRARPIKMSVRESATCRSQYKKKLVMMVRMTSGRTSASPC
jgi:hypothetical protein